MKKNVFFILLMATVLTAVAQIGDRPGWTVNVPKAGNSTYIFVVERATGASYQAAYNNAIARVFQTTILRVGTVVRWDEINAALKNGSDWGSISIEYNIPVNKVCEYSEQTSKGDGYVVWVLCQVAKSGNIIPDFDEFLSCHDTRTYSNGKAALKSAIIPGLGQMGKRRYGTGIFTLLGETVLIGGAVGTYIYGKEVLDELKEASRAQSYKRHLEEYNLVRLGNIVFTSAAAAFYVYNIIRAATITPRYKKDPITIEPTILSDNTTLCGGIGINFNF